MRTPFLILALVLAFGTHASGEVLIRWDQDQIPSPQSLGISTVVVPASNGALVRRALGQGYRLLLEVEASRLASLRPPASGVVAIVVTGAASRNQLLQLEKQLTPRGIRIVTAEERGQWPHIRTNWVTKNNEVLQVTSRSAQPWIETNAALVGIVLASRPERPFVLTYRWSPITVADIDEGPALDNYLVAIGEAGSFGADLMLPLHAGFQRKLLLGDPQTRIQWNEIRRYMDFFSWNLPSRYRSIANVGVITADPGQPFEMMNLLVRHNLAFEVLAPTALRNRALDSFDLLLVFDVPKGPDLEHIAAFANRGGTLVVLQPAGSLPWRIESPLAKTDERITYRYGKGQVIEVLNAIADPNEFALEVRQVLGSDRRAIDIWNGITVLTTSFREPEGTSVLVTAVNYAHQPLPVQIRVRGTFSVVHYESPEEALTLLPYQHRGGYTEFVVPSLRVGGRVFLSK